MVLTGERTLFRVNHWGQHSHLMFLVRSKETSVLSQDRTCTHELTNKHSFLVVWITEDSLECCSRQVVSFWWLGRNWLHSMMRLQYKHLSHFTMQFEPANRWHLYWTLVVAVLFERSTIYGLLLLLCNDCPLRSAWHFFGWCSNSGLYKRFPLTTPFLPGKMLWNLG